MAQFLRCRFIGEDGSLGYVKGRIYVLCLATWFDFRRFKLAPRIVYSFENHRGACPYGSQEAFNKNWEKVGWMQPDKIPQNQVSLA